MSNEFWTATDNFVAIHIINWSEICFSDEVWVGLFLLLKYDGTFIVEKEYVNGRFLFYNYKLNEDNIKTIRNYVKQVYDSNETTYNDGCDGEGVSLRLHLEDKEVKEIETGYIYGTKTLEPFVNYVRSLIRSC